MAPRSAKTKKATEVKVADAEVPKKDHGKSKNIEDLESETIESEISKIAPISEKNTKRRKKAAGSDGQGTNGVDIDKAPPAKKSRKKNMTQTSQEVTNGHSGEEVSPAENGVESNGHLQEPLIVTSGKGKKKTIKKDSASKNGESDSKSIITGKKNNEKDTGSSAKEVSEDKPKLAGKGKGRRAPLKEKEVIELEDNKKESKEEMKTNSQTVGKGKKRTQTKSVKESTPDSDKVAQLDNQQEENVIDEPKKKQTKAKKAQLKKKDTKLIDDDITAKAEEPATKKRKVTKKDGKGDAKGENEEGELAKGKKGKKVVIDELEAEGTPESNGVSTTKSRRKPADIKASSEDSKKKGPPKNKATTNYDEIDFSNFSKNTQGKDWNLKIASWNVDGIRAWMNKGGLDYLKYEKPDILCLQETKCSKDKLPDEIANLPGYHAYWQCSDKDGYAGVGIYTTKLAMNVQYGLQNEEMDSEGRIITAEYEQFYLICTYVPNAGRKLVTLPKRLQWNEEFRKYVKELNEKKPVIICGDMNVAHNEIDLKNPKTNKKNAGFTEEERAGMTDLLSDGIVDVYRHLKPNETDAYTFWTYMSNARAKNVGWRLDYFLMSEKLLPSLCDSVIRSEVYGSDHCPISLFLHITSADKPKE